MEMTAVNETATDQRAVDVWAPALGMVVAFGDSGYRPMVDAVAFSLFTNRNKVPVPIR